MGINILVCDRDLKDHPDWDTGRTGPDVAFQSWIRDLPKIEFKTNDPKHTYDAFYRPADFTAWRVEMLKNPDLDHARVSYMLDLLEGDPDLGFAIS